ncbi:hypothetical protein HJFPF1_09829 [Paramyrothecium foliicola]|nr:hypothetical protein HJFPF1_09829 [Paramyrothecium foliicola]
MPSNSSSDQIELAILCTLACEYNAIELLLEDKDTTASHVRADGDPNVYTMGRIGHHPVVLVRIPKMGKASAAGSAASLRSSFPHLSLVILTGVCGGVPNKADDMLLGDVVVGKFVVQSDFGRHFPDHFEIAERRDRALNAPPKVVSSLIATLETSSERYKLEERAKELLKILQGKGHDGQPGEDYRYPGGDQDRLFETGYLHKHQSSAMCLVCNNCRQYSDPVCEEARGALCTDLGCDVSHLVKRQRQDMLMMIERLGSIDQAQQRRVFFGCISSADKVLRSSEERERLAEQLLKHTGSPLLAVEMEAAGIWDELPCLVVKGVADYADSHKNKGWQNFASALAACVTRAIVERYPRTDRRSAAKTHPGAESPAATMNGAVYHGPVHGKNIVSNVFGNGTNTFTFS